MDCPVCKLKMQDKVHIDDHNGRIVIVQCPKCKTIDYQYESS